MKLFHYKKSIEFRPDKAELYSNYSVVLKDKYELEESLRQVENVELKPDFYDAYWNKALAQLAGKNYKDGWKITNGVGKRLILIPHTSRLRGRSGW